MIHYLDCADAAVALFALFDNPQDEGAFTEVLRWRESLREFLDDHVEWEVRAPGFGMPLRMALPFVATGKYIAKATGGDGELIANVGWDATELCFVILDQARDCAPFVAQTIAELESQDWFYNLVEVGDG